MRLLGYVFDLNTQKYGEDSCYGSIIIYICSQLPYDVDEQAKSIDVVAERECHKDDIDDTKEHCEVQGQHNLKQYVEDLEYNIYILEWHR